MYLCWGCMWRFWECHSGQNDISHMAQRFGGWPPSGGRLNAAVVAHPVGMRKLALPSLSHVENFDAGATGDVWLILFDYEARLPGELFLIRGNTVSNVVDHGSGWGSGILDQGPEKGRVGLFPLSHVKALDSSVLGASAAVVVWDFDAEGELELSLRYGDVLVVQEKTRDWWYGRKAQCNCGGEEGGAGWFPAAYVRSILVPRKEGEAAFKALKSSLRGTHSAGDNWYVLGEVESGGPLHLPENNAAYYGRLSTTINGRGVVERGDAQGFLTIKVLSAMGVRESKALRHLWRGGKGLANPCVHLYLQHKDSTPVRLFTTKSVKHSRAPVWNEAFQINLADPDCSRVILSVLDGTLEMRDKLGSVVIDLDPSARARFARAGGEDRLFSLEGDGSSGALHLIVEYRDAFEISRPTGFRHVLGFDEHWGEVFRKAGLSENQLSPEVLTVAQKVAEEFNGALMVLESQKTPTRPPSRVHARLAPTATPAPTPTLVPIPDAVDLGGVSKEPVVSQMNRAGHELQMVAPEAPPLPDKLLRVALGGLSSEASDSGESKQANAMAELLELRDRMNETRRARNMGGDIILPKLHKPELSGGLAAALAETLAQMELFGVGDHEEASASEIDDVEWDA